MDLRTLRYVATIARLRSFTRAAAELRVAQPALSVSIRKLEDELGVQLFARESRQVVPTTEGLMLLRRAERIFQEVDSAKRELEDAKNVRSGEVRLGFPPMYGLRSLPALLAEFHVAYPGVAVTAMAGSATEISNMLENGSIDLALLELRRIRPGWQRVLVGRDEMVLCVARTHPLAKRRRIKGKELDGLPMALLDSHFIQRQLLDAICGRAGARVQPTFKSNYVPLIRAAALNGMGAVTLVRSLADADDRLASISFEPRQILSFNLCWRDDRYLSRANLAFVEFAAAKYKRAGRARTARTRAS
jgi:LysR family transcriptional regulator, cyn operon transcriptional activator